MFHSLVILQPRDTYGGWRRSISSIPDSVMVNVTVNCSCGERLVSKDYGLFSIAKDTKMDAELLQRYNPGVNFSQGSGLVFIPGKDKNGVYVPLPHEKAGHLARSLATVIGGICMVLLLAICIYTRYFRKRMQRNLNCQKYIDTFERRKRGKIMPPKLRNIGFR
ncbi:LysM receptor kinase 1b [Medicago truncatula]|uniref:LysM receptor kinase 1b n=1 Tax=Medicago truncatula TaxID=3880 RepID=G7KCQ1_MEDTR|nr:LysM receptor kinase 1b [Medicago truncatula]